MHKYNVNTPKYTVISDLKNVKEQAQSLNSKDVVVKGKLSYFY